jgi:hypothetical protein
MRSVVLFAAVAIAAASPALAEDLVFTLINDSSVNLVEMYVAPHSSDSWGENILSVDTLAAGEQGEITIADGEETCDYDMRFVMDNGATVDGNQDLCELGTFTLHD